VTYYRGERAVFLVKYDNVDFDAHRAFCNADVLRSALLDATLESAFDDVAEVLFCSADADAHTRCQAEKLLGHLNCHKRFYNSLIWLSEDPNERVMRWSCCRRKRGGFNFIHHIDNDPIAVYGDFVVFAVAGKPIEPDPSVPPVSTIVTMPTPAVYSEGILGHCNTCETIDKNTFHDWKDSPCPDCAPTTTTLPTPQGGVKISDLQAEAVTNLISTLLAAPDAPASIIKDLVTSLLTSADSGSATAKDLLDKLLEAMKG
jgi:hypothetical protein